MIATRQEPKIVRHFSDIKEDDHLVFAYGSLLIPESLARTINRDVSSIEYFPALLINHVREWGAPSRRLYASPDGTPIDEKTRWLSLSIRETGSECDVIPGAIVKLQDREFQQVIERESNYHLITVTDSIQIDEVEVNDYLGSLPIEIKTFVAKSNDLEAGIRTAVRDGYYNGIDKSLAKLHPDRASDILDPPSHTERLEAYIIDDDTDIDEFGMRKFYPNLSLTDSRTDPLQLWHDDMHRKLYSDRVTRTRQDLGGTRRESERYEVIPFVSRPLFLARSRYHEVIKSAETIILLMAKAQILSLKKRKLSDMHRYTEVDRQLSSSTLDNNHAALPPVARVDMILGDDGIRIFEVNADSPAGMFHLDKLTRLLWEKIASRELTGDLIDFLYLDHEKINVCDAVVQTFYKNWEQFIENSAYSIENSAPRRIAIVDVNLRHQGARAEFDHFEKLLSRRGVEVSLVDIKDLKYEDGKKQLVDKG